MSSIYFCALSITFTSLCVLCVPGFPFLLLVNPRGFPLIWSLLVVRLPEVLDPGALVLGSAWSMIFSTSMEFSFVSEAATQHPAAYSILSRYKAAVTCFVFWIRSYCDNRGNSYSSYVASLRSDSSGNSGFQSLEYSFTDFLVATLCMGLHRISVGLRRVTTPASGQSLSARDCSPTGARPHTIKSANPGTYSPLSRRFTWTSCCALTAPLSVFSAHTR